MFGAPNGNRTRVFAVKGRMSRFVKVCLCSQMCLVYNRKKVLRSHSFLLDRSCTGPYTGHWQDTGTGKHVMARKIRSHALENRTQRLKLPVAKKPLFVRVTSG
jgi:hypothetical protein